MTKTPARKGKTPAKAPARKGKAAPAKLAKGASKAPGAPKAPPGAKAPAKPAKGASKAPGAATAAAPAKYRGIWADAADAAAKGKLPPAPDFSAPTHAAYRARLDALIALAKAGDLKGLAGVEMVPPRSSSPKALHRYRDLAMIALRAQAAK